MLEGGTLGGTGTITGDVQNVGGAVAPGASPGLLTIDGTYTQFTGGTFAVELAGTTPDLHDVLDVTGDAFLAGTLSVTTSGKFEPMMGQMFTILTTDPGMVFDQFEFFDCGNLYTVDYLDQAVVVTATSIFCAEDVDCDGDIGFNDVLIVLSTWGPCPATGACLADVNGDEVIGFDDLLAILSAWGPCR